MGIVHTALCDLISLLRDLTRALQPRSQDLEDSSVAIVSTKSRHQQNRPIAVVLCPPKRSHNNVTSRSPQRLSLVTQKRTAPQRLRTDLLMGGDRWGRDKRVIGRIVDINCSAQSIFRSVLFAPHSDQSRDQAREVEALYPMGRIPPTHVRRGYNIPSTTSETRSFEWSQRAVLLP